MSTRTPKRKFSASSAGGMMAKFKKAENAKKSTTSLNSTVMRLINKSREIKRASYSVSGSLAACTGTGWNNNGIVALTPYTGWTSIVQGTGQGDRLGNKIEVVKAVVRIVYNPNPYNASTNAVPQPQVVTGWVATAKNTTVQQLTVGVFFQAGDSSAAMAGNLLDMTRPMNTDVYTLYRKYVKKIGYAAYLGTGAAPQAGNYANNDYNLGGEQVIDITKYVPKIIDYNDTTTTPLSKVVWLYHQSINADGSAQAAAYLPTLYNMTIEYQFRDA